MGDELRAVKITNPFWLGKVAPFINDFLKKIHIPGVTYETLYTYLASTVQNGAVSIEDGVRDRAELWVVFEDKDPVAFGHWFVKGLPTIGMVHCDLLYSWQRKREPANLLFDEFKRFGIEHRAQIWEADASNRVVFEVFKKACESRGLTVYESDKITFMGVIEK